VFYPIFPTVKGNKLEQKNRTRNNDRELMAKEFVFRMQILPEELVTMLLTFG
jgi:hypothetical protein